jgi:hypothetical protein
MRAVKDSLPAPRKRRGGDKSEECLQRTTEDRPCSPNRSEKVKKSNPLKEGYVVGKWGWVKPHKTAQ